MKIKEQAVIWIFFFHPQVDSSYDARDYEGALRNANIAKWLNLVSILCGIILIVVVFVIMTT